MLNPEEQLTGVIKEAFKSKSNICNSKMDTLHDLKTKLHNKLNIFKNDLSDMADHPGLEMLVEESSRKLGHAMVSVEKSVNQLESINSKMDSVERRIDLVANNLFQGNLPPRKGKYSS
mmetsp:Transcript_25209/g.25421  ORF Transcript_25209/g.25421 Transcript_25209/m.25421 type:complete len:118 (+) Transcript_25209:191-544(+)